MSEAEKSIAVKRKVAVARPISRRDSPNEYLPKRKKLDPSPPPYIPSRKEEASSKSSSLTQQRHLSHNDARHTLGKDKKALTSRSRREELQRLVEHDRNVSNRSDSVLISEKRKKIERQVKGDTDVGAVKNFQITTRVVSPKPIKVERDVSPVAEVKSCVSSRLGKVVPVVQRRSADAREDIQLKKEKLRQASKEEVRGRPGTRMISRLGKAAVQKQCEAAVQSVKATRSREKVKMNVSPDSRVVCCDSDLVVGAIEQDMAEPNETRDVKSGKDSDAEESMSDDLAQMLDDDLEPEVLDQHDEFTLDLDDDDITNVVGEIEDEDMDGVKAVGKVEESKGTRFIVTLDGVDERQFDASESSVRQAIPGAAIALQTADLQKEKLLLDLLTAQTRSALQQSILPLSQASQALTNKLQPPRIQPFSINLKDSDDEHEEKEVINEVSFDQNPDNGEDNVTSALKKAKMSERCKFWPACAAGSGCEYHHPTTHCKTFPNCKFGDKCLFIHPNCKFDSKCSRPDCPFTHTSRRPNISNAPHVIAIPQPHVIFSATPPLTSYSSSTQVTCRYFPNCYNVNCVFLHPKPCRFGPSCKNSTCTFYHPPLPGRSKLKWQAQTDSIKTNVQGTSLDKTSISRSTVSPSHSTAVSSTSQ